MPQALASEIALQINAGGLFKLILEFALLFAIIMATVLIVQGVRRVPIQVAKHMVQRGGTTAGDVDPERQRDQQVREHLSGNRVVVDEQDAHPFDAGAPALREVADWQVERLFEFETAADTRRAVGADELAA